MISTLRTLLAAAEQRAVVTAVQHYTKPAEKTKFLKARQEAKEALAAIGSDTDAQVAAETLLANFFEYVAQLTPAERKQFRSAYELMRDYLLFEEARR